MINCYLKLDNTYHQMGDWRLFSDRFISRKYYTVDQAMDRINKDTVSYYQDKALSFIKRHKSTPYIQFIVDLDMPKEVSNNLTSMV